MALCDCFQMGHPIGFVRSDAVLKPFCLIKETTRTIAGVKECSINAVLVVL